MSLPNGWTYELEIDAQGQQFVRYTTLKRDETPRTIAKAFFPKIEVGAWI